MGELHRLTFPGEPRRIVVEPVEQPQPQQEPAEPTPLPEREPEPDLVPAA